MKKYDFPREGSTIELRHLRSGLTPTGYVGKIINYPNGGKEVLVSYCCFGTWYNEKLQIKNHRWYKNYEEIIRPRIIRR